MTPRLPGEQAWRAPPKAMQFNVNTRDMEDQTSQVCKKITSRRSQADHGRHAEADARAPAAAVYLLWATAQKGRLTAPVPSGGGRPHGAGGRLPGPTAGGWGGGGERGGGGGGRTSREKATVPGGLKERGGATSTREQGPADVKEGGRTRGRTDPGVLESDSPAGLLGAAGGCCLISPNIVLERPQRRFPQQTHTVYTLRLPSSPGHQTRALSSADEEDQGVA